MERKIVTVSADENILDIKVEDGIKANSVYTIKIRGVKSADGTRTFPDKTFVITTSVEPMYCSLESVKALVDTFNIPEGNMISFIHNASLEADFISGGKADPNDFAVQQFARTKAVLDCLLHGFMTKTSEGGASFKLGDAEITDATNSTAFKNLLKLLQDDLKKWQDAIRGYYNEGRVKPKATRVGIKSSSNSDVQWTTVDRVLNDITRNYPQWS